ncbi:DUF1934 domain-containing protein [Desulforamulus aeronauticus]|uniref:Uncharacterized beta-barrel protein YwiB, DUF1934 family n=1 Tax=Desulforamulus aeronauticus DSM 10349 TaxID=1121421 RepID=A0A1M6T1U8_9FIRM|nr:DUF1934 domain-containing protein [Desulforamulus aeronauticus]SHK50768.1 Uncharacterized beta-barrel protein YwiB, DUF1934 family [Desulforamulus aeronauticus DSM 10349]
MGKEVLVTIKATRRDLGDENEIIELISQGIFYRKKDCYYILYKETELSGLADASTTLKVEGNTVTLIRNGSINMRQVFEQGQTHRSLYQNTLGCMEMVVRPWNVEVDLTDFGGSIKLEYELELDGAAVGVNSLEIAVKEV